MTSLERMYCLVGHDISNNSFPSMDDGCHGFRASKQQAAEMSTDQDWRQFWQDRTWSDCRFFLNWWIRTGSDWENLRCFNVIILNISKILVVIRFHRFAKWQGCGVTVGRIFNLRSRSRTKF